MIQRSVKWRQSFDLDRLLMHPHSWPRMVKIMGLNQVNAQGSAAKFYLSSVSLPLGNLYDG